MKAAEEAETTTEPAIQCGTQRAIRANGGRPLANPLDTHAIECKVTGSGITEAAVRHPAEFQIVAHDGNGTRKALGGDAFFVAIRGSTQVRARVTDNRDGTYSVVWTPPQSGAYSIAVSYFGDPLPGSPFNLTVYSGAAHAAHSLARGKALFHAVSRASQTFYVMFKDRLGHVAQAVDLDVFVEPLPPGSPRTRAAMGTRESPNEGEPNNSPNSHATSPAAERAGGSRDPNTSPDDGRFSVGRDNAVASFESKASSSSSTLPSANKESGAGTSERPDISTRPRPNAAVVRDRAIRVKVGKAALVIRKSESVTSPQIGQVNPGQMVTVLKEVIYPKGKVRAMIDLTSISSEGSAPSKQSTTTRKAKKSTGAPAAAAAATPAPAPAPVPAPAPAQIPASPPASAPASAAPAISAPAYALAGVSEQSPAPAVALAPAQSSDLSSDTASTLALAPAPALAPAAAPASASLADAPAPAPAPAYTPAPAPASADVSGNVPASRTNAPTRRRRRSGDSVATEDDGACHSLMVDAERAPEIAMTSYSSGEGLGWVTLVKEGNKKLVTSRVRQSANSRQQHAQQWTRRVDNDKKSDESKYKDIKSSNTVDLELSSDPTGIGFAFGGIYPGTIHAKGQLHEKHSVSYSIGLVGEYLLHVRLRPQAAALPGSPYRLQVTPGPAVAQSTTLPQIFPLAFGTVGTNDGTGCGLVIKTADVTGNACIEGGARVTSVCTDARGRELEDVVISSVEDKEDGSYAIIWKSQQSGTFNISIQIDDKHVCGSPTQIKFISTQPDLSKCEIEGDGLYAAVAGQPACFTVKFFDEFGNPASPDTSFMLGLAIVKSGEKTKMQDIKRHDDYEMIEMDGDQGLYQIKYTARTDGTCDLHVWAEGDEEGSVRVPLPNSPYRNVVSAGIASAGRSFVETWSKESRAVDKHGKALQGVDGNVIIAGDTVIVRPQICDELGNKTNLPENALHVSLVFPDGSMHVMEEGSQKPVLKMTTQTKGGITTYDVRHDPTHAGDHEMHFSLHGTPILGSPITFKVTEAVADVKMCKITPPSEPTLYSNRTYATLLQTFDRFGNPMSHGGLPVSTRLQLIKAGVHDLTTLMPNNHTVEVDDRGDGTYLVKITLIKIAASLKLFINMDKNIPSGGGELPPVQLNFLPDDASEDPESAAVSEEIASQPATDESTRSPSSSAPVKGTGASKLRSAIGNVQKLMGQGDPTAKPKSAIGFAADALADAAGKAKQQQAKAKEPGQKERSQTGGFGWLQNAVNAVESATGLDLDGDGTVGGT